MRLLCGNAPVLFEGGRRHRNLPYRRKFFIYTEGEATEAAYLKIAAKKLGLSDYCELQYRGNSTNILQLIALATKDEKAAEFRPKLGDQIWILVDHDEEYHFPQHFQALHVWEQTAAHRHVALPSPRFEYWLLLHFLPNPTKKNAMSDTFVGNLLPHFRSLPLGTPSITRENIEQATQRAQKLPIPTPEAPAIPGSGMGELSVRVVCSPWEMELVETKAHFISAPATHRCADLLVTPRSAFYHVFRAPCN